MERRFTNQVLSPVTIEKRADGSAVVVGYGAVFFNENDPGTEYKLYGGVFERIMPGAFDRALQEKDDVRGLFNHDASLLLGRTASGTMRLNVDAKGLRYEIDAPDTTIGRDIVESIKRGDLTGSSFAFVVERAVWVEEEERDIRQIEAVRLFDTGPVTYPAYEASTTGLRSMGSLEEVEQSHAAWKDQAGRDNRQRQQRSRLVELELS